MVVAAVAGVEDVARLRRLLLGVVAAAAVVGRWVRCRRLILVPLFLSVWVPPVRVALR